MLQLFIKIRNTLKNIKKISKGGDFVVGGATGGICADGGKSCGNGGFH